MIKFFNKSLARSMVLSLATRISAVAVIASIVSFLMITQSLENQKISSLEQYISERATKESIIFQLAEDNHRAIKSAFLARWEDQSQFNGSRFNAVFERKNNGTFSERKPNSMVGQFDAVGENAFLGTKWLSAYISQRAPVASNEFRHRALLAYDLINHYGPAWAGEFQNIYAIAPEGASFGYWPGVILPHNPKSSMDLAAGQWFYLADKQNNPTREVVWTSIFYDGSNEEWLVSSLSPIDDSDGNHLLTVNHDVVLNELFARVYDKPEVGAYSFIAHQDGRLVAHPDHLEDLLRAQGQLYINTLSGSDVVSQFVTLTEAAHNPDEKVVYDSQSNSLIAFEEIEGPDWYMVTVYPKSSLTEHAVNVAVIILLVGLISIALALLMLYRLLLTKVLRPIHKFEVASKLISQNKFDLHPLLGKLAAKRTDEMGRLANSFMNTADTLKIYSYKVTKRTEELEQSRNIAEQQARTDLLTDLPNRRAFFELANFSFSNAKRYKANLSLIAMDIDKFKRINDNFGHDGGDAVLRALADELKLSLRKSDLCARIGGEEFAILVPDASMSEAQNIAEQLRNNIKHMTVMVGEETISFTSSFGVCTLTERHNQVDDMLKEADIALYQAKGDGRDRVVLFEPENELT